ncbi:tumor necrosis factor ligand superfamily member 12 isoform X4 [Rhinatrema bivittatum]|uniref:tumor necrosis factor ligand superfamily member 12 isoform X4 n=1 Tax=Rhinatrema bivittatum TaxID=194408 RepID=UPI00112A2703|nr:tumor necrosis factor ligand superfamily member 12 isoform X4 [Rhinatrema bivittatum]
MRFSESPSGSDELGERGQPCSMRRAEGRRARAGRGVALLPLALAGAALLLASLSLLLAAASWARVSPPQDLPEDDLEDQGMVRFDTGWDREQFLYRFAQERKPRQRRTAPRNRKPRNRKTGALLAAAAAHYEELGHLAVLDEEVERGQRRLARPWVNSNSEVRKCCRDASR